MDTDRLLRELTDFLRIPSVSTSASHNADYRAAAEWVAGELRRLGCREVQFLASGTHPVVWGVGPEVPGSPTVLVYGHYDVQPPEPLDLWITPPFEPTVRKTEAGTDAVYARGAVDDKGQVWAHLEALTTWQAHGGVPVNIILLIEGEEEIGSENLEAFVERRKDDLRADIAVISDTNQFARGLPAITYGLRGLCYCEVFLIGPDHD